MVEEGPGWWRRHALTIALLLTAFGLTFLIRSVYMAAIPIQFNWLYIYGGGSDSFYHSRVTTYIILNHANLVRDYALNYPLGAVNPREPLFDWMNAIFGILFAPFFQGNAVVAGAFFLSFGGPFWAALSVFPIYLIGREANSPKMGLVAALLYPFMVASIDSSTLAYGNYLSFYTFFVLLFLYSFLRTVKAAGSRRWVDSYARPRGYPAALRGFLRTERTAVKWAIFTGVSLGALALAWQGYTYAIAIAVAFVFVQLIIERIRRVDSFGLYVLAWIIGIIGFPMALPYYLPQGLAQSWFDLPLLIYFGGLLILLPFVLLRDQPWIVSLPVLGGVAALGFGLLYVVNLTFFEDILSGQGYFAKTLIYQTVAEAQATSIDVLVVGYGIATFVIAFIGLVLYLYATTRARFRRVQILFIVYAILSLYLPLSAAKFLYIGAAAFALLAAIAIARLLDVGGYPALRRDAESLAGRGSAFLAVRKSLKLRHFLVIALVAIILVPNVWYAVDAAVPYNSKNQFSQQIYQTFPPALRGTNPNASLGAAGTELDTPTQYDEASYNWLATQDQNLPPDQRPAFLSWWDYGFQAVDQGLHPTVADNFQNGIDPAGNFLLSQNESLAIGVMTTTLLAAEQVRSGDPYLPAGLNALLARDGVNLPVVHNMLVNRSTNIPLVLSNPGLYVAYNRSNLDANNAMYGAVSYELAGHTTLSGMAQIYGDVEAYTGWTISYPMVDNRLFPLTGSNTGIFYAPAQLTDRLIGAGGAPVSYFTLIVVGSDGKQYPAGATLPAGVTASQTLINRLPTFYNSMIYRTFIGYNGTDIGLVPGIPGLGDPTSGAQNAVTSSPIEPAWMLQHFQVVYRTAYYCPGSASISGPPGCPYATNILNAGRLAKQTNGTASTAPGLYFQGGAAFLQYYNGQPVVGTVTTSTGLPVPQARVTVYDNFGIPHSTSLTDRNGAYSVIVPPGNVTVNVTTGPLNALAQAGTTLLASYHLYVSPALAARPGAPTLVVPVTLAPSTVQTFTFWSPGSNSSYDPLHDTVVSGANVTLWGHGLPTLSAVTDASGAATFASIPPGVYNFSVRTLGWNYTTPNPVYADPGKSVNQTTALPAGQVSGRVNLPGGSHVAPGAFVSVRGLLGQMGSAQTNSSGGYLVTTLPPGNYSISASLASAGLATNAASFAIAKAGAKASRNLTLVDIIEVQLDVVANGAPATAIPVRFSPVASLAGAAGGPANAALLPLNSTVVLSDSNGFVDAILPDGNYSIYALGLVGNQWYSAFSSAFISGATVPVTLPPLFLKPTYRLSGALVLPPGVPSAIPTLISAYTARGDQVSTVPNATGSWALLLPAGTYSLSAVALVNRSSEVYDALLENVTVPTAGSTTLVLGPAFRFHAEVGVPSTTGPSRFVPAVGAVVQLSVVPTGGQVTTVSDSGGNVSAVLPTNLPTGSSYCLVVNAQGFAPLRECGFTSNALAETSSVPLGLVHVYFNVTVAGLPSGNPIELNLTAASPTAQTLHVRGGPLFDLTVFPGDYDLTAWTVSPTPPGLILPTHPFTVALPIGTSSSSLTLLVARQVPSVGSLVLPAGVSNKTVVVRLSSSVMNLNLTGPEFTKSFFVAPTVFQVYANATGAGGAPYSELSSVTVNDTGVFSSAITLSAQTTNLTGNLLRPNGVVLPTNTTLSFVTASGLVISTTTVLGQYRAVVPSGRVYFPEANVTALVTTVSGPRYESFVVAAGAQCTAQAIATTSCNVPLASAPIGTSVTGVLSYPGFPQPLAGTVRLTGPFPSANATLLSSGPTGFSVSAVPGVYSLYATTGEQSGALANVSLITVPATGPFSVNVQLHATWVNTLTILPPAGSTIPNASLWVHGPPGVNLVVSTVPTSTPFPLALPVGIYQLQANATSTPYGVPANLTAQATVSLLSGNAATRLSLGFDFTRAVGFAVASPTNATIPNGGRATFAFLLQNVGNAPVTFHLKGAPSLFGFTFSPENVSLGTTSLNNSIGGEVTIAVPAGTAQAHPPIVLEAVADTAAATVYGTATPAPVVQLIAYNGLQGGAGAPSSSEVGSLSAVLPFYVLNTGNIAQSIAVGIQNAQNLAALGWASSVYNAKTPVNGPIVEAAGANMSLSVHLTAIGTVGIPPASVVVSLQVLNVTATVRATVTLTVPTLSVSPSPGTVSVTGPELGSPSPYPDWLVPMLAFIPAIGLMIGVVVYRWNKTRRWVRR